MFIRSLVGLDREAAKQAFSQFLSGGTATANQVEFVNMIVDYLTENGVMDPKRLYESPFTDVSPRGPEGVFSSVQVDQLVAVWRRFGNGRRRRSVQKDAYGEHRRTDTVAASLG